MPLQRTPGDGEVVRDRARTRRAVAHERREHVAGGLAAQRRQCQALALVVARWKQVPSPADSLRDDSTLPVEFAEVILRLSGSDVEGAGESPEVDTRRVFDVGGDALAGRSHARYSGRSTLGLPPQVRRRQVGRPPTAREPCTRPSGRPSVRGRQVPAGARSCERLRRGVPRLRPRRARGR